MIVADGIVLAGGGKNGMQLSHALDCNMYVLDGGDGEYALIDAGCGLEPERVLGNLARAGVDPAKLKHLLLTHAHGDHAAGARFYQATFGAQVVASHEAADWIERGDMVKTSLQAAIQAGVYPADFRFPPCPVARRVGEGDTVQVGRLQLKVIDTPGHAGGHIAFLLEQDGEKSLFGGDSVFAGGRIVIQNIWDCSIPAYADTVAKLHRLHIDRLFPGHGAFLLADADRHIKRAHDIFQRLDIPPNL